MAARAYPVRLTAAQHRVAHDVLAAIANDPDWSETTGARDWTTFGQAVELLAETRTPCLTGGQLRVLRSVLSLVANAPDVWADYAGGDRAWSTFGRAVDVIVGAHVDACRAEALPCSHRFRRHGDPARPSVVLSRCILCGDPEPAA